MKAVYTIPAIWATEDRLEAAAKYMDHLQVWDLRIAKQT